MSFFKSKSILAVLAGVAAVIIGVPTAVVSIKSLLRGDDYCEAKEELDDADDSTEIVTVRKPGECQTSFCLWHNANVAHNIWESIKELNRKGDHDTSPYQLHLKAGGDSLEVVEQRFKDARKKYLEKEIEETIKLEKENPTKFQQHVKQMYLSDIGFCDKQKHEDLKDGVKCKYQEFKFKDYISHLNEQLQYINK